MTGPDQQLLGADDGTRTRDPHLGKVMLYQLSHVRVGGPTLAIPCRRPTNRRTPAGL
jgi:hypothetical protein